MPKYGAKASEKVERAMHELKEGSLKSGQSNKPVKSRAQAIAIGLSEARKEGGKVPTKTAKAAPRKSTAKKAATNKTAAKKTTAKKAVAKKAVAKKSAGSARPAARKVAAKKAPARKSARLKKGTRTKA